MNTYSFMDNESGEMFFVEADTYEEAREIAVANFSDDLEYYGTVDFYTAEMMGLDTY